MAEYLYTGSEILSPSGSLGRGRLAALVLKRATAGFSVVSTVSLALNTFPGRVTSEAVRETSTCMGESQSGPVQEMVVLASLVPRPSMGVDFHWWVWAGTEDVKLDPVSSSM